MKLYKKLYFLIKKLKLKNKNIKIERNVSFYNTFFEGYNKVGKNTVLSLSSVGKGTYIGSECRLINSKIGKFCSIAGNIKVIYGKHPVNKFVSTHPSFFSTKKQSGFTFVENDIFEENKLTPNGYSCEISDDVWIGESVLILEGLKINRGAIIAAGSVVTKDVPPFSIVGGNPCKIIKYRFNKETIKKIEKTEWWNQDLNWISENRYILNGILDENY